MRKKNTQTAQTAAPTTPAQTANTPQWVGADPFATPVAGRKPKMGVNPNARSRSYYAGVVLAHRGFANGITPEMVAEVCALYGTTNWVESDSRLRYAYHALTGYFGGLVPPGTPAVGMPTPAVVTPTPAVELTPEMLATPEGWDRVEGTQEGATQEG